MVLDSNTIASVVIGGILSGLGGYLAAKRSANAQISAAAQAAFIPARLSAFQELETALEAWVNHTTPENYAAIYRSANAVRLIAGDKVVSALKPFQEYLHALELNSIQPSFEKFGQLHSNLLDAMRDDLLTYPIPKSFKNRSSSRKPVRKQSTQ